MSYSSSSKKDENSQQTTLKQFAHGDVFSVDELENPHQEKEIPREQLLWIFDLFFCFENKNFKK